MSQIVLGIDVGSYSIKIAKIERGFGEFNLVDFYEIGLVAEEVLTYEEKISATLSKFLEENRISYDSCVVSLPATQTSFRTLELPFANVKKIDQTLLFELETLIPLDIEDILFDYSILLLSSTGAKVLSAYVKKQVFENFLKHCHSGGFDPRFIGIDVLDLSYLTCLDVLPPLGRYGVLDLGHKKTNLIVLEGSQVKTVRAFSWGGHNITEAIGEANQVDYSTAQDIKHSGVQVHADGADVASLAALAELDDFMKQLKQTLFAFYESGEKPIEALYLTGGTSRLQGVESFFSRQLSINVGQLDVSNDHCLIPHREEVRPVMVGAMAAALRVVFPNKGVKINFRRGDYAYKRDIEQLEGSLKKVAVFLAIVVFCGLIYFGTSYLTLSSQVKRMNESVTKLVAGSIKDLPKEKEQSVKKILSLLSAKSNEINEKLTQLQGEGDLSSLEILRLISTSVPPRDKIVLDINEMNVTPKRVRIKGQTNSFEAIDQLKASLENVKVFKNVQTGNLDKVRQDAIKFSLSLDIASSTEIKNP